MEGYYHRGGVVIYRQDQKTPKSSFLKPPDSMCHGAVFCAKRRRFPHKPASWGNRLLYVSRFLDLGAIAMSICPFNFKYRRMENVHYQIHFSSFLLSMGLPRAPGNSALDQMPGGTVTQPADQPGHGLAPRARWGSAVSVFHGGL